jgi:flavocytochrome c
VSITNPNIIIVGAGSAGMVCAIMAAQAGAKVWVLEKTNKIGGTLHWTGGHLSAGGTRRQKALGIEDSWRKHYNDIQRITGRSGDADLILKAVKEAPHTIDWLEDLGFEFAPECPRLVYGHVPYKIARTHYGVDAGKSIYKVLKPLWDRYVKKELIELRLNTSFKDLVFEGEKIIGILAEHEGKSKIFLGEHVVISTGGYGSNRAFFNQQHPDHQAVIAATNLASMGEGHEILQKNGAELRFAQHHLSSLGGIEFEPESGRADYWKGWGMVFTTMYRPPREIYVNAKGQRFMAEDEFSADVRERVLAQQPGEQLWAIFDEKAFRAKGPQGEDSPLVFRYTSAKMKADLAKGSYFWKADTLEELAQKSGLPASALVESANRFNQHCEQGSDPDFGRKDLRFALREGPFYALLCKSAVLVTFGGIKVNRQLEVIGSDGKAIKNLYAIGEILGLGATSGDAFCGGMALTPALSFGRILGRELAAKVLQENPTLYG